MSFELLKELVGFVSAIVTFVSALSSGQVLHRSHHDVDPLKWGAICFTLGAAFIAALFLLLSEQSVVPIGSTPLVQWGGVFGFCGAVLGLISAVLVKKEVRQAIAQVAVAGESGVVTPKVIYKYPEVIFIRNPHPPLEIEPMIITTVICGTVMELSLVMLKFTKRSLQVEMLGGLCGLGNPIT